MLTASSTRPKKDRNLAPRDRFCSLVLSRMSMACSLLVSGVIRAASWMLTILTVKLDFGAQGSLGISVVDTPKSGPLSPRHIAAGPAAANHGDEHGREHCL